MYEWPTTQPMEINGKFPRRKCVSRFNWVYLMVDSACLNQMLPTKHQMDSSRRSCVTNTIRSLNDRPLAVEFLLGCWSFQMCTIYKEDHLLRPEHIHMARCALIKSPTVQNFSIVMVMSWHFAAERSHYILASIRTSLRHHSKCLGI